MAFPIISFTSDEYSKVSSFAFRILCLISSKTSLSGAFTLEIVSNIVFRSFSLLSSETLAAKYTILAAFGLVLIFSLSMYG